MKRDHFDVFPTNMSAPVVQARMDTITEDFGDSATDAMLADDELHGFHILTDDELAQLADSDDYDTVNAEIAAWYESDPADALLFFSIAEDMDDE